MTNEEIISARAKYEFLKQERDRIIKLKKRMQELSKNKDVSEYIAICNELKILSNIELPITEDLIYSAFGSIAASTTNPCNVYLYLGLKEKECNLYLGCPYKLTIDDRKIYKNLDNGKIFCNYAKSKQTFESNNQIIDCSGDNAEQQFNMIRYKYFTNLLNYDSEEAIQKTIGTLK